MTGTSDAASSESRAESPRDSRASDGSGSEIGSTRGSRSSQRASSLSTTSIRRVCTFWIGRTLYALDVRAVRRIIAIENAVPVPRAQAAVVGLQIQRGAAVPLIDIVQLLELQEKFDASKATTALVVEADRLVFGVAIDRVDAVINVGKDALRRRTSESEPEVFAGVFDEIGSPPRSATLLHTEKLLERVGGIRFHRAA
jgi:chemotaxis signal transduction protein